MSFGVNDKQAQSSHILNCGTARGQERAGHRAEHDAKPSWVRAECLLIPSILGYLGHRAITSLSTLAKCSQTSFCLPGCRRAHPRNTISVKDENTHATSDTTSASTYCGVYPLSEMLYC